MKKFNVKEYQNKKRVFVKVAGYTGISKLFCWNEKLLQYEPPIRGKSYEARRSRKHMGRTRPEKAWFNTLEGARNWQIEDPSKVPHSESQMRFSDIVERFKSIKYTSLEPSTRDLYDRQLRLHFASLMPIKMCDFNPRLISEWIEERKKHASAGLGQCTRKSFDQEFRLLTNLVNFTMEYFDDVLVTSPIKARHRHEIVIRVEAAKSKDITEAEFLRFREHLLSAKNGRLFYHLATVQHYQALRISEAAALDAKDVTLNDKEPQQSQMVISKSIYYPRRAGCDPVIKIGFKNSKKLGGRKVSNILPESYKSLRQLLSVTTSGLLFTVDGTPLTYRSIQYAYDRAAKLAGLPYTGTHVLRHGGGSLIYNQTGDLSMVAEHLGNTVEIAKVYAHRDKQALKRVTSAMWDKEPAQG